ncbi:hypothetical protein F01_390010 [Burkholderia cenocepacia]|nr:hypothetical protein F01_390010 [Burkholderia cenocepacia]
MKLRHNFSCAERHKPAAFARCHEMKGNIALNMFPFISLDAVSRMPSSEYLSAIARH